MPNSTSTKIPTWFWVVAGIALLWNLMGVMSFIGQVFISQTALEALPADQQAILKSTPLWAKMGFALAVFAGTLGCVALLMRKAWAVPLFIASLVGVIVQNTFFFFMTNAVEVYGTFSSVMTALVVGVAIFLIWLSRDARTKGWIS